MAWLLASLLLASLLIFAATNALPGDIAQVILGTNASPGEAERLRALIACTGDAIISARADGILDFANPAAERLVGLENLAGCAAGQVLPAPLAMLIEEWQESGNNTPACAELPWPDGTIQMVSLAALSGNYRGTRGWVAALRDITNVKKSGRGRAM